VVHRKLQGGCEQGEGLVQMRGPLTLMFCPSHLHVDHLDHDVYSVAAR
jgi:hypothetical protein